MKIIPFTNVRLSPDGPIVAATGMEWSVPIPVEDAGDWVKFTVFVKKSRLGSELTYRSQWDVDANNRSSDCGQTCVAMLAEDKGMHVPINSITVGSPTGMSTPGDLVAAFAQLGFTATANRGVPVPGSICLVSYGALNGRMDTYKGGHWLILDAIVDGFAVVRDPDWWGPRRDEGNGKKYLLADFMAAYQGVQVTL